MKIIKISNWSTKDQQAMHLESEVDGIGKAQARLSLAGDMAILDMNEERLLGGGNHFGDPDFEILDLEELDTPVWSEEVSDVWQLTI